MTPHGRIMTVGSPEPVASYTMNYELSSWGDGGHLIYTCSLDLCTPCLCRYAIRRIWSR